MLSFVFLILPFPFALSRNQSTGFGVPVSLERRAPGLHSHLSTCHPVGFRLTARKPSLPKKSVPEEEWLRARHCNDWITPAVTLPVPFHPHRTGPVLRAWMLSHRYSPGPNDQRQFTESQLGSSEKDGIPAASPAAPTRISATGATVQAANFSKDSKENTPPVDEFGRRRNRQHCWSQSYPKPAGRQPGRDEQ